MAQLTQLEISNWISIYVAAGICCAIAITLSVATLSYQLYSERAWSQLQSVRGALLFLPKAWWRWQKLYLLSTPVTLAVTGSFAASLSWS